MSPSVEDELSVDQSGLRDGHSCASQELNLTQYIEDGYETRKTTGAIFIVLKLINNSSSDKPIRIRQFGQVRVV